VRLAVTCARLDGGRRTRDPSASSITAEPFAPVCTDWPSLTLVPTTAGTSPACTSPLTLVSVALTASPRSNRVGMRRRWPGTIRFGLRSLLSVATSRQAVGEISTLLDRPINVSARTTTNSTIVSSARAPAVSAAARPNDISERANAR